LYLVYLPPSYPDPLHGAFYDWTDYGNNGPGGWSGYFDTDWQMRCVSDSSQQSPIICPMEDTVTYLRELMPKIVLPETADQTTDPPGCTIYTDDAALYWCNAVDVEADKDKLYCAGTWRLYNDGVLLDEYVDAPGQDPAPSSFFRKIYKDPGVPDASFTTYRVHMGVLWIN
jgi:hypothetical protein